jgi:hypothetical protein
MACWPSASLSVHLAYRLASVSETLQLGLRPIGAYTPAGRGNGA